MLDVGVLQLGHNVAAKPVRVRKRLHGEQSIEKLRVRNEPALCQVLVMVALLWVVDGWVGGCERGSESSKTEGETEGAVPKRVERVGRGTKGRHTEVNPTPGNTSEATLEQR